jgi:hypothetical protein
MAHVRLDTAAITDWPSFHDEFRRALGFPDFYGANLDAWIDCMSYLRDDGAAGMASLTLGPEEVLLLELPGAEEWRQRVPEIAEALWDCAAVVNRRCAELGEPPSIALVPVNRPHSRPAT